VALYGGELILVDGLIDAAGRLIRERAAAEGWFDLSTLKEPYRAEGKKTMGIELAEDGGWGDGWCPDVIVYPTGGGTGIVGMWKAFDEMERLGWIGRSGRAWWSFSPPATRRSCAPSNPAPSTPNRGSTRRRSHPASACRRPSVITSS